jgi:hypothetical protein
MFLPVEYLWLESVLIAAIVVFFVDWIGNSITFSNRLVNALVTAIIFALIFGVITYFGYGGVEISIDTVPAADAPVNQPATPAN